MFKSFIFNIFEKKAENGELEKAKKSGLITQLEYLKLKSERADEELKNYLLKGKKRRNDRTKR